MSRRTSAAAIGAALGLAASMGVAAPARAAPDTEGPSLTFPAPLFSLAHMWSDWFVLDPDELVIFSFASVDLRVWASDPSGICGYAYGSLDGNGDLAQSGSASTTSRSFSGRVELNGLGGSTGVSRAFVTAYDCAGNETTKERRGMRLNEVEVGATAPGAAHWRPAYARGHMGGSALQTSRGGAGYTIVQAKSVVGLIMAKGPTRGRADVVVDGLKVATVDTYASRNKNQVVVWTARLGAGRHTITVENRATPGRSRIDVDGLVYYRHL